MAAFRGLQGPIHTLKKNVPTGCLGGGSGIRTHGTLARTTVFETAPFDRSGIPPRGPLGFGRAYLAPGSGGRKGGRQRTRRRRGHGSCRPP